MKKPLLVVGGVVATGLTLFIAYKQQEKKQSKLTAHLFDQLNQLLNPSKAGLNGASALDVNYVENLLRNNPINIKGKDWGEARADAERIYHAWGNWFGGDDEAAVYGVFRDQLDWVQISTVAKAYRELYGDNLIEKIKARMDDSEVSQIISIIQSKDPYRLA